MKSLKLGERIFGGVEWTTYDDSQNLTPGFPRCRNDAPKASVVILLAESSKLSEGHISKPFEN